MKLSTLIFPLLFSATAFAQFPEYRITDEGKYQYLANQGTLVFDETYGTIYKPITIRTFFLEVVDKGYLPVATGYTDFTKLGIVEQRKLLQIPYEAPADCSVQQSIPEGCLVYGVNPADDFLDKNATMPVQKPVTKMETVKLFFYE